LRLFSEQLFEFQNKSALVTPNLYFIRISRKNTNFFSKKSPHCYTQTKKILLLPIQNKKPLTCSDDVLVLVCSTKLLPLTGLLKEKVFANLLTI